MQKTPKLLVSMLLLLQLTTKAMNTLEDELTTLHDELNTLALALSPKKKPMVIQPIVQPTPQPIPQPQPQPTITTNHAGLQVIGERTLPNGKKIIVGVGDVEKIENVDAVVNAANRSLLFGAGVSGAIDKALDRHGAAKEIYDEIKTKYKMPAAVGSATPTHVPANTTLKKRGFKYIIHAVGPDCRVPEQEKEWLILLQNAYQNSLHEATKLNLTSITIPPISIGIFQCDYKAALNVMMHTIVRTLLQDKGSLQEVILVVWSGGQNPPKTALEWLKVLDTAIKIAI